MLRQTAMKVKKSQRAFVIALKYQALFAVMCRLSDCTAKLHSRLNLASTQPRLSSDIKGFGSRECGETLAHRFCPLPARLPLLVSKL